MEIFRSMTQTVLGSNLPDQTPSGADTVERVVERVVSSSLLEDRRDGCRALRALSRKYRLLVGAHAMDALIHVLENDRSDHELVNYVLETLIAVTSPEPFSEEIEETGDSEACCDLGEQFTEILTKKTENIALFLGLLDEFDFKVRYPTVKLFSNLLENKARGVQEGVLAVASGVPKLMDLLSDSREVIRNQMLLLLTNLTRGNATLQKIVVFENIYDHLFDIIRDEGYCEGGVVVEDCLELLLTLLRTSPPNQTLLREGGYSTRLNTFLTALLEDEEERQPGAWAHQKMANVHKMLELISSLVQPSSSQAEVSASQSALRHSGVLASLCRLLLASGVPATTLTATVTTLADVISGHQDNQAFFSNVMAPSTPPRPAVVVLLMSLVNEKQSLALRCAVLHCLRCLLTRNAQLQEELVSTLLPQTAHAEVSSGQLLCGGLFSGDPASTWLCAAALTHALHNNAEQKEQLLRVQLATGSGSSCVSLLHQCCSALLSSTAFLSRAGLLQLLVLWILHCPRAVTQLLAVQQLMPFLTSQISSSDTEDPESQVVQGLCAVVVASCALYNEASPGTLTKDQIAALVTDRIGSHVFRNKITALPRSDRYLQTARETKLQATRKQELCFTAAFVEQFRLLESSLLRAVNIGEAGAGELLEQQVSQLQTQLSAALQQVSDLTAEKEKLVNSVQQLTLQQQQQALLLQQQQQLQQQQHNNGTDLDPGSIAALQQQVAELSYARDYYYYQMMDVMDKLTQEQQKQQKTVNEENEKNATAPAVNGDKHSGGTAADDPELETLRCQLQDLQLVLQKKDESLYQLQQQQRQTQLTASEDNSKQVEELQRRLQDSEQSRVQLQQQLEQAREELQLEHTKEQLRPPLQVAAVEDSECADTEDARKKKQFESELSALQSEQEDLLLLLAEQDGRLQRFRSHLILRGVSPPPGEEEEEDDDGDGEDENLQ